MSKEDGNFAGIPDPNKMDYFDPFVDLIEIKYGNSGTTDGNSARNHSDTLGMSNVPEARATSMSPGREYTIQTTTRQQQDAWNSRFE